MPGGGIRVVFAGGGTGGHVFPGLALAAHPRVRDPFWLCTSRPFDAQQLGRAGVPHEALESPRWRGFSGFLAPFARSILASSRRLREVRPDVVIGVGGYGTVPPAVAAKAAGIPYVLLEQNVRPGKANRFLATGARRIYVQWAEARGAFAGCGAKTVVTGSPLRKDLVRRDRAEALQAFGLEAGLPVLAVVGGSQGADALNRSVVEALNGTASKLQVIHVSGRGKVPEVEAAYARKGARAVVREFVQEMDVLYSAADLVVSRAGAMAIAELAAFEVPAVLVPIPRSAADHQRENARAAARSGGAILVEEASGPAGLAPVLERLARRDPSLEGMRGRWAAAARTGAAEAILDDLEREVLR